MQHLLLQAGIRESRLRGREERYLERREHAGLSRISRSSVEASFGTLAMIELSQL